MPDIVSGHRIIVSSAVGGADSRYRDGAASERRHATGRRRSKFVRKIGYRTRTDFFIILLKRGEILPRL